MVTSKVREECSGPMAIGIRVHSGTTPSMVKVNTIQNGVVAIMKVPTMKANEMEKAR
jgi:hypothetical protein